MMFQMFRVLTKEYGCNCKSGGAWVYIGNRRTYFSGNLNGLIGE